MKAPAGIVTPVLMWSAAAVLAMALLACGSAAEAPARIPFELTGDHTFVDVEFENETLSFVFDTGAGAVVFDAATARRLGVEPTSTGSATGAAGTKQVPWVRGVTLQLGSLRIEKVTAAIVALDHLAEGLGRPLHGIIGQDVLRGRVVLIDYDRRVLETHDRGSFPFGDWGEPCRVEGSAMLVDGELRLIDGQMLPGRFHFDSGAGLFLGLSSRFVDEHGLAQRVGKTYSRTGLALTGVVTEDRVGRVAGVTICGQEFPSAGEPRSELGIPAELSGATAGVLASSESAGLIGNGILQRYNAVFDLNRKRIYLKPNRSWSDPIRTDASGLQLVRKQDGSIEIEGVSVPSPAADLDLRPGDRIQAIDDTQVATIELADLRDRLREPGRSFRLAVVRDGQARTVTLLSRVLGGDETR